MDLVGKLLARMQHGNFLNRVAQPLDAHILFRIVIDKQVQCLSVLGNRASPDNSGS